MRRLPRDPCGRGGEVGGVSLCERPATRGVRQVPRAGPRFLHGLGARPGLCGEGEKRARLPDLPSPTGRAARSREGVAGAEARADRAVRGVPCGRGQRCRSGAPGLQVRQILRPKRPRGGVAEGSGAGGELRRLPRGPRDEPGDVARREDEQTPCRGNVHQVPRGRRARVSGQCARPVAGEGLRRFRHLHGLPRRARHPGAEEPGVAGACDPCCARGVRELPRVAQTHAEVRHRLAYVSDLLGQFPRPGGARRRGGGGELREWPQFARDQVAERPDVDDPQGQPGEDLRPMSPGRKYAPYRRQGVREPRGVGRGRGQ